MGYYIRHGSGVRQRSSAPPPTSLLLLSSTQAAKKPPPPVTVSQSDTMQYLNDLTASAAKNIQLAVPRRQINNNNNNVFQKYGFKT